MVNIPSWIPIFGSQKDEGEPPFREFIYLDEVSVISLLASLTREITESRIDKETIERRKTWKYRLRKLIPFIDLGGATQKINRNTEEVNRKSEIQSKFDELYSHISRYLEIGAEGQGENIAVSSLSQGGLVEVRVDFSAHEIYHFYRAYQYLFEIFEAHADDLGSEEREVIELMGSLFGEQIPVKGEAINYYVEDGEIKPLDENEESEEGNELVIYGTLDPEMLWQNAEEFLFDENEFVIFGRISDPELKDEWDPVKLTQVIKSINEQIGNKLQGVIEFGLTQAKQELNQGEILESSDPNSMVSDYYNHIEEEYMQDGQSIDDEERQDILEQAVASSITGDHGNKFEVSIELLRNITEKVDERFDLEIDREDLSEFRADLAEDDDHEIEESQTAGMGNYLEMNIIGVYW